MQRLLVMRSRGVKVATAASYYAARGLSAMDLKALFGWSQFSTAIAYIEESPERLEGALQQLRH